MIEKTMIDNSPLSPEVMRTLRETNPPLPPIVIKNIDAAQKKPAFLKVSDLQGLIFYDEGEIQLLENLQLQASAFCDTGVQTIVRLEQSHTIESKKMLAEMRLAENDFTGARAMLNTVTLMNDTIWWKDNTAKERITRENQNYCKLMHCMVNVIENGRTLDQMNTSEIQTVREVANEKISVSAKAEVLLTMATGEKFEHPIKKISQPMSKQTNNSIPEIEQVVENIQSKTLKVYPNPTNNLITVEFFVEENQNAIFDIYNILGEKLIGEKLSSEQTTIQISMDKLSSGVYFYIFSIDKMIKEREKITIIK